MKKTNLIQKPFIALLASAQALAGSVNIHDLNPSNNPSYTIADDAIMKNVWKTERTGRVFFGLGYDYINDPLVALNSSRTSRTQTYYEGLNALNFNIGYTAAEVFQIGLQTSLTMLRTLEGTNKFAMSDSKLYGKIRLNKDDALIALALMPELYIPTGNTSNFVSNSSFGFGLKLLAEKDFGFMSLAANLGGRYAPSAQFQTLDNRAAIPMSIGAMFPIGPRWAIDTGAATELPVPSSDQNTPSVVHAGLRYRMNEFVISGGAGVGALNASSSADYRIYAGINFLPEVGALPVLVKPVVAEIKPAPVIKKEPRVIFTKKEIQINEEVKFEHAKAVLTPAGKNLLDEVADVILENKKNFRLIMIEGHTNELGGYEYNQKLSDARAKTVKEYLAAKNIDAQVLFTVGYGKTRPKVAKGLTKEKRLAVNRRVEFKVVQ